MLLLNYYSTLTNKQTGSLSENERKFPPIVSSPSKLKNPTSILFFYLTISKKLPLHLYVFLEPYVYSEVYVPKMNFNLLKAARKLVSSFAFPISILEEFLSK